MYHKSGELQRITRLECNLLKDIIDKLTAQLAPNSELNTNLNLASIRKYKLDRSIMSYSYAILVMALYPVSPNSNQI